MSDNGDVDRDKQLKELQEYIEKFEAAFDELHEAVVKRAKTPGRYISPHHDFPRMSLLDSGFPSFRQSGFYDDSSPRDYLSVMRLDGLPGLLGGYLRPEVGFPKGDELVDFLKTHDIGKRLPRREDTFDGKLLRWQVDRLVGEAVERYLHLYGLDTPVVPDRRRKIVLPLARGTVMHTLNLRMVAPIAMTHFEVDHFPLSDTTYIVRIPKKLQLARARMNTLGTGAGGMVVGAATHAFVSNGWHLGVDSVDEVSRSLNQSSANVIDAVDSFFGALRIATGVSTGYAQILWLPRKWALEYFCDLTPVYGTAIRRYPDHYDDYGWARSGENVSTEKLAEVGRIYRAVVASNSEAIRLALRRLNGCLTRTDDADAVLDGTIGLELLLGDDQNQSLSYKLRLRAGALATLQTNSIGSAGEVADKVKRLYDARSSIVHGLRKKSSRKASEPTEANHTKDRENAANLLRFVLEVLLTNPEYQNPSKIDKAILLRSAVS